MKREKTIIKNITKTNIKARAIILFSIIVLFCIFGISACGGDLPTSSISSEQNNDNININKTNLPLFDNSYRYLSYFTGSTNMSYKNTESLTKLWLSVITNSVFSLNVDNGKEEFNFVENGDLYWIRNNNSRLIKKFHGGTMVILKDGYYSKAKSVGGVYTYAMSRAEANKLENATINKMFNRVR